MQKLLLIPQISESTVQPVVVCDMEKKMALCDCLLIQIIE